jgi:hypothetical protein
MARRRDLFSGLDFEQESGDYDGRSLLSSAPVPCVRGPGDSSLRFHNQEQGSKYLPAAEGQRHQPPRNRNARARVAHQLQLGARRTVFLVKPRHYLSADPPFSAPEQRTTARLDPQLAIKGPYGNCSRAETSCLTACAWVRQHVTPWQDNSEREITRVVASIEISAASQTARKLGMLFTQDAGSARWSWTAELVRQLI